MTPPPAPNQESAEHPRAFRRRHRLTRRKEFHAVFAAKARASEGDITVYSRPNDLGHGRLGLSVGRRAGSAVERSRIKRLVREAFRLTRAELPGSYDFVVSVRSGRGLTLEECQATLLSCARRVHEVWERRARRAQRREGEP